MQKLMPIELPELRPLGAYKQPEEKKQSLQELYAAGGGVPAQYKDRPHVWHKKVQRYAEGGSVYNTQPDMSDGGQIIPEQQMARGGAAKARPFKASDLAEPFTEGLFPMIYGGAKGTVAGLAGLPGELESLARAGYNYGSRLSPQAPLSRETLFPTIEEVSRALPSTGRKIEEPYTKLGENMLAGLVNPAAVYRTGVKGAQALAPKLGQATDRYMTEMGMMPGVAPKGMPAPKGEKPIVVRTPEEQSIIDKFGQKQKQEAKRTKKVEKANKLAEDFNMDDAYSGVLNNDKTPKKFYHGSMDANIKQLEPNRKEPGIWFTRDFQYANDYAKGPDGKIYSANVNVKNPLVVNFNDDMQPIVNGKPLNIDNNVDIVNYAIKKGYDGVHFPDGNFSEADEAIVAFHPHQTKILEDEIKSEAQVAKTKIAKPKGPRSKVQPDIYRQMEEAQGAEAVLKAARAGEHLKPTTEGYTGAPRTVTSPQGLGAMRRGIDQDFIDSVEAVKYADPDRMGTWYDRAKQGMEMSTEPHQLPRTLEQHAVYSAGVSPENELAFALKHGTSRGVGDPVMAYRGAGMKKLDEAAQKNEDAKLAFKIGEYKNKNDPRLPNTGLFGVNDFRRAQGMGYTDPQGMPWKAGVSDTMHPFMDAETALQVERANAKGLGGRTDWQGPHIQEVPWVYGKAQDFYGRGSRSKSGKYFGDEAEGMKQALIDANNTARDYFYKHTLTPTSEAIPGAGLGHVESALSMTPEEKLAYSQRGRFDVPYPSAESPEAGAATRDAFYSALNLRQMPARQGQGMWINPANEVENNPLLMPRVLVDFPTGGGGMVAPSTRKAIDVIEQNRALMDAQHGGGYNLPNTQKGVTGKNALVIDSRSRNPSRLDDPSAGVMPTAAELTEMDRIIKANTKKGQEPAFGVTATERGVLMYPYDSNMDPKTASSFIKKVQGALTQAYPGEAQKALATANYVPGVGKRSDKGPITTAPYSGEATSDLLSAYSEIPQHVATNVGESEAIRRQIREKMLRDEEVGGARGDIQETRRFFSEADWPRAVEMIRQGMAPAAAIAALGYNAASMAQEKP